MSEAAQIRTDRLLLRPWRREDREPFGAMNADPEVMEHFPSVMTQQQTDEFVDRIESQWADNGWGLFALEVLDGPSFIGYTGLWPVTFEAAFTPAVEIGWRLQRSAWGQGYATEAALASLDFGWSTLGLDEVVSFTATSNTRSMRVMERIGMTHEPDLDFDHPRVPEGHPIRPHVFYRIRRP